MLLKMCLSAVDDIGEKYQNKAFWKTQTNLGNFSGMKIYSFNILLYQKLMHLVFKQMWELNFNGTLVNSYSGLCATVNDVKGDKFETSCLFFFFWVE